MLFNFGKNRRRQTRDSVSADICTTYELWGMGFTRKMIDSDLSKALVSKGDKWEDNLWDRSKVAEYMAAPDACVHFTAFRAWQLRTETIKGLSGGEEPSAPWPANLICLICGKDVRTQDRDTIGYVLSTLDEKDRQFLERRYRDGSSFTAIARETGMTPAGVSSRIRSLLSELRNSFAFQMLLIGRDEYEKRITGDPSSLIFELPLSLKYKNVLFRNNIFAVADLSRMNRKDIVRLPHGGEKLADDLAAAVEAFGCDAPFTASFEERERLRRELKIVKELGTLSGGAPGRKTELNLVSRGGTQGYDIRKWSSDGKRPGEGITLSAKEAEELYALLGRALSTAEDK